MKLQTKYHGEKEIDASEIITFPQAIPGFPNEKQFVLLPLGEDFFVLQSTETKELAFIMTNPFPFFQDYDFELEEHIVELLEIESEEELVIFSILTVHEPFEKTTTNLQAPVVINIHKKKGKQVILNQPAYQIKHPLFQPTNQQKVKG